MQINPQHNVPCLVDGDFIINESVAIQIYLGEKFSDNKPSLYPKDDLKIKSTINQRLVFNSGVFWDSVMKPFVRFFSFTLSVVHIGGENCILTFGAF